MMTFASDSVFRFTSLCMASISVPASNWFSLDCVFLMISLSNIVVFCVGIYLTHNKNILQLTVCAFSSASVCTGSVSFPASNWFAVDGVFLMIFVSSFVMYVGISLTINDNVLADDASIRSHFCCKCLLQCALINLLFFGLRFSVIFCC